MFISTNILFWVVESFPYVESANDKSIQSSARTSDEDRDNLYQVSVGGNYLKNTAALVIYNYNKKLYLLANDWITKLVKVCDHQSVQRNHNKLPLKETPSYLHPVYCLNIVKYLIKALISKPLSSMLRVITIVYNDMYKYVIAIMQNRVTQLNHIKEFTLNVKSSVWSHGFTAVGRYYNVLWKYACIVYLHVVMYLPFM